MKIGLDFDNTIICYDRVFHACALERGLIAPSVAATKHAVRAAVRETHGPEAWIRLQSHVYVHGIREAVAPEGVREFLTWARDARVPVCVVSHKTRLANLTGEDLHAPAWAWLRATLGEGLALVGGEANVHFEETIAGKLARIRTAGCTHFVDDLEEVLTHADFPAGVERLQYGPMDWKTLRKHFENIVAAARV